MQDRCANNETVTGVGVCECRTREETTLHRDPHRHDGVGGKREVDRNASSPRPACCGHRADVGETKMKHVGRPVAEMMVESALDPDGGVPFGRTLILGDQRLGPERLGMSSSDTSPRHRRDPADIRTANEGGMQIRGEGRKSAGTGGDELRDVHAAVTPGRCWVQRAPCRLDSACGCAYQRVVAVRPEGRQRFHCRPPHRRGEGH